jgi:hypothetical protein
MKMVLIQNEAQCAKCGQIIFSRSRHDFVSCKCGAIAVDGGMDYRRIVGNLGDVIDRSMYITEKAKEDITSAVKDSVKSGRNDFGVALAVIRALRDNDLLDMARFK